MNKKHIISILITLVILLVLVSRTTEVSNFFGDIGDVASDIIPSNVIRNVSLSLTLDNYDKTEYFANNVNIILNPKLFSAKIGSGSIESSDQITITNYTGSLIIQPNTIIFDGNFQDIEIDKSAIKFQGESIKGNSSFDNLVIENLEINKFSMDNANGKIKIGNTDTTISNEKLIIKNPKGTFYYDQKLRIEGFSSSIEIPDANIVVK